ncbi:CHAP domain-containing protein [Dictyobacter kobayashii]|uniref:Peptidase C51 domain-containing protein n=1 Tax=Dictyobacter kobayashii TaxID=2014872 RepID=A0A402AFE0_9CHLR|nr:CHAP domain-containing protein [Dictyobacter kobayashii]GCE17819.1 hypothetical protein KDK_16190 [Dictyobacter kobayashii]
MFSNEHTATSSDVEQLDFDAPVQPMGGVATSQAPGEQLPMVVKEKQTGELKPVTVSNAKKELTSPQRGPVLIPATAKKSSGTLRPPKGRRAVINVGATIVLMAVVIGALAAVIPVGSGSANGWGKLFQPGSNMVTSRQNNTALIAAQAATATAVTQDGFEYNGAGGKYSWAGVQNNFTLPDGSQTTAQTNNSQQSTGSTSTGTTGGISSSTGTIADSSFNNPFTAGQCTYWADYEYHHLTGYAVPWTGNASAWAANASAYGWNVSSQPHVPSIIVLQPGTQYAGWAGHVAVVEKINSDGSVATTNWNVVGWGVFSWNNYTPGPGVSFVWHS